VVSGGGEAGVAVDKGRIFEQMDGVKVCQCGDSTSEGMSWSRLAGARGRVWNAGQCGLPIDSAWQPVGGSGLLAGAAFALA
jgi:hypothetical protein